MKNDYKIIFVDIDWTILSHKEGRFFDIESINALKEASKKGIKVFICTSRPIHTIKQIGLFDLFKPDGMIVCNGGLIVINDKIIYEDVMSKEHFERVCEITNKYHFNLEAVEPYHRFLLNDNFEYVSNVFGTYPEEFPEVEDYHNRHIITTLLFADENSDEILKKEFPKDIVYFRFHPYGVDVHEHPHDKGEAVHFALNYLKIDKKFAIAFGDDNADISMFNEVGLSFAMANGKEEVKEAASFVTDEVWNHGVRNALIKNGIIKEN